MIDSPRPWWCFYSLNEYLAFHAKLRRERGKAEDYLCELCEPGTPSHRGAEWACVGAEPDLVPGISGSGHAVLFSRRTEDYRSACKPSHRRYDRARAQQRRADAHVVVSPPRPRHPERPAKIVRVDPTPEPALFEWGTL